MVFLACCFLLVNEYALFVCLEDYLHCFLKTCLVCEDNKFVFVVLTQWLPICVVEEFAIHILVKLILVTLIAAYLQFA